MSKACILAVAIVGLVSAPTGAEVAKFSAGGTGSATELMRQLTAEYAAKTGGEPEIVPSLGSTGAIYALLDGRLDIAVTGRSLNAAEQAKGLKVAFVARTPFVLATSHRQPNGLNSADLVQSYLSSEPTWRDGTPIRVILRPRAESDVRLMGSLFSGLGDAMAVARKRPGAPTAATDQDNADWAEQIPGSLIGSSLTQIILEKRDLRIVPIEGHMPTMDSMRDGTYPYVKTLHFVTKEHAGDVVENFLAFLDSERAQDVLRQAYVFPGRIR